MKKLGELMMIRNSAVRAALRWAPPSTIGVRAFWGDAGGRRADRDAAGGIPGLTEPGSFPSGALIRRQLGVRGRSGGRCCKQDWRA